MAPIKSLLSIIALAPLALAAPQDGPATASTDGLLSPSGLSLAPGPVILTRSDLVSADTIASVPSGVVGSELSNLGSAASASGSVISASAASVASQITGPAASASTSAAGFLSSVSNELSSAANSLSSAAGSAASSGVSTGAAPKETGVIAGAVVAMGGIVGIAMAL